MNVSRSVAEDQGKPIEFLLGVGVTQDIDAGAVRLDMAVAISKLAQGLLTPEELRKVLISTTPCW